MENNVNTKYIIIMSIGLVDPKDPYRNLKNDWSQDESMWPELDYFDIINYLVNSLSHYTIDERSYKNLDVYNHCAHRWVQGQRFAASRTIFIKTQTRSLRPSRTSMEKRRQRINCCDDSSFVDRFSSLA